MKLPHRRSIAVYPFRDADAPFLLLKRTQERGGFWQPVTGTVEASDALTGARARHADVIAGCRRAPGVGASTDREQLLSAALREMEEETGIDDVVTVVDLGIETRFEGYDGLRYRERAFAAEVAADTLVRLSREHTQARWVTREEAEELLEWRENLDALDVLVSFIQAGRDEGA